MAFGPVRHNSRHHHQHIHHVHSHQSFKNRPILARADYGSGKDHGSGVPHHNNATLPGNSGSLRGSPIWFSSGSFLSHQRFMDVVRQVLFAAGINTALYSGHSFRIGADGHSGQRDTNPWAMESSAYQSYTHLSWESLRQVASVLVMTDTAPGAAGGK